MASENSFGRYLFVMAFSGSMVIMGMNELHSMYDSGKFSTGISVTKRIKPQAYVDIFYGSSRVERGAFGKKYAVSSKNDYNRLNDKDKSDIKRLVKKVLR